MNEPESHTAPAREALINSIESRMATNQIAVRTQSLGEKKVQIIDLSGVLDIHTTRHFEKTLNSLIAQESCWIIVNFKHCDYISSAGLGTLVGAARELRRRQGDLRLEHLSDKIERIVKLLGFDRVLKIYKSEKEALLSFK